MAKKSAKVKTKANAKAKVARSSSRKKSTKELKKGVLKATQNLKNSKKVKAALKGRLNDLLDRRLLEIATKQYARLMRELARGRKRLDAETKVARQVGERIIAKAKEVKETLVRK